MGQPTASSPALIIMAVTSRHEQALAWTREQVTRHWGPLALCSPVFDFTQTDYYTASMGAGLKKTFITCAALLDPARVVDLKLQTGEWEAEYARVAGHSEPRPLNLDPGYLTAAKLVLASTKDHAHRIYLNQGIYAEVTLYFKAGRWQDRDYTFPDYRRADYQQFFSAARDYLRRQERARREPRTS